MPTSTRILLVEGRADEAFFSEFCKSLQLSPNVTVAPPRAIGGSGNNKEGVFRHLPVLLKQFADGRIENLAVIIDADHSENHGLGYNATVEKFSTIVTQYGFQRNEPHRVLNGGLVYKSTEGFPDLGLWVMPGKPEDGTLENWVKECIASSEQELLVAAINAVEKIKKPKFSKNHNIKAEIATWLAWQSAPGRGMENAVSAALLDSNHEQYKLLANWLRRLFP